MSFGFGMGFPRSFNAAGGPSLNFQFAGSTALDPRITFTRTGTTATYFNSAGVLTSAGADVPRFDYNPSTLAARGLLIEEQRTNLCLQSADLFENGTGGVNWIWPAGVVTGNTQTAPDGTTTADTITTTGGAQSVYQSVTVTASTSYTFSVFVKLGTMSVSDYKIAFYNNIAATFIASDIVPTQVPNTSSWTRISYTFTTPVGCTSIRVYPFRNAAPITSSTVFIWGAQLEAGAFPTSYIPTTVASATRNPDQASVNTLSPWYNSTAGTTYFEGVTFDSLAAAFPRAYQFNDGTNNNVIQITRNNGSGAARMSVVSGGVAQAAADATAWTLNATTKAALAYATNDFAIVANGGAATTDTSGTVPTVTNLLLSSSVGNIAQLNGWLRRIVYYPRRLSNAELQSITS